MRVFRYFPALILLFFCAVSSAQRVVYSTPENSDTRRMNFEIIGKVSGNFLIYKNIRDRSYISVYDQDMQQVSREYHGYIPQERLINVDFYAYSDFVYMIYQYQRRNVVYCQAVKLDGNGKKISDVMQLDTTHIGFAASNRIYSTITSDNKSHIMVFKINARNKSRYIMTTMLYNDGLELQKSSRFIIPMEEYREQLDEFSLDNEGDLVFTKFRRTQNETITDTRLMWKRAGSDTLQEFPVVHSDIFLDEPHIKVDNVNRRYFLTSFYYTQRRGNIEGFYFYVWDKDSMAPVLENSLLLADGIRKEAKGDATVKTAFNDFFIRNVIIKKDGGFLINTESYYTSSRFSSWNRWNYLYGPPTNFDYYSSYSPVYRNWWWRNRTAGQQTIRHHADNVMILSFDRQGNLEWNNVIHKDQFDDEAADRISFLLANTGGQLHYVFNTEEKSVHILNDFSLTPDGQITNNHSLKNLDRGYEFLPKYGKQVSSNQMIIPCYFRNYICFAKIEYN